MYIMNRVLYGWQCKSGRKPASALSAMWSSLLFSHPFLTFPPAVVARNARHISEVVMCVCMYVRVCACVCALMCASAHVT